MRIIKLNKHPRPLKWVIQDSLFTILTCTVQLVESMLALFTLGYFTLMLSDKMDVWSMKRQLKRRTKNKN
jgi:hypothetical protein